MTAEILLKELETNLAHVVVSDAVVPKVAAVNEAALVLGRAIVESVPVGTAVSSNILNALKKLEEVVFHANAGIVRAFSVK